MIAVEQWRLLLSLKDGRKKLMSWFSSPCSAKDSIRPLMLLASNSSLVRKIHKARQRRYKCVCLRAERIHRGGGPFSDYDSAIKAERLNCFISC